MLADYALPISATAGIISLFILYYIIKAAVHDGTKEQRRLLEIQNRILIHNLKKEGDGQDTIEVLTNIK